MKHQEVECIVPKLGVNLGDRKDTAVDGPEEYEVRAPFKDEGGTM